MADNWQKAGVEFIVRDSTRTGVAGAQRNLGMLDRAAQGVARNLMAIGAGYIGFRAITAGFKSIASAAMAAQESENLFTVSMGKSAQAARSWSDELSRSLGLNEYQVRQNVATFNVMFDSMGIGSQKALEMSQGLTQLAYDMASFYNLKPEEAFRKLQAGITGEVEPLKRLGIIVNETTVEQHAMKIGLIDQNRVMSESEKILARYSLILSQTQKAQGDLERTSDSATNVQRRLNAQWEEFKVHLGEMALPAITDGLQALTAVVEGLDSALSSTSKTLKTLGLTRPPMPLWDRMQALSEEDSKSMLRSYFSREEIRTNAGRVQPKPYLREDEGYLSRLTAAYERAAQVQEQIREGIAAQQAYQPGAGESIAPSVGGVLGPAFTEINYDAARKGIEEYVRQQAKMAEEAQKAKDEVAKLDAQLDESIQVTAQMADGHQYAADAVRYESAVMAAYGDDLETANDLIDKHRTKLRELADEQKRLSVTPLMSWTELGRQGLEDLSGTLTDIVMDFDTAEQAAEQFARALASMMIQEMVMRPLVRGIGASFGLYHGGGVVGTDGVASRTLPAAALAVAPRLHAGLRSDEYPAILQRGEQVIPRGGGMSPNVSIKVDNRSGGAIAQPDVSIDVGPDEYIIGVVLRDAAQGGRTRDLMRRGV